MKTTIRQAVLQDAPAILRMLTAMADTFNGSTPLTEEYVKVYLSSPSSKVLLAEIEGQAAGLLSYSLRPDLYHAATTCWVEELVVLEEYRSQGVGGALLENLLARLETEHCAEVSLAVLKDNLEAIRFYRSHGLTDEGLYLEKHFDSEKS